MAVSVNAELIGIGDLAERWQTTRNFIWRRCKSGKIPRDKIGERWFIHMDFVLAEEERIKRVNVANNPVVNEANN